MARRRHKHKADKEKNKEKTMEAIEQSIVVLLVEDDEEVFD